MSRSAHVKRSLCSWPPWLPHEVKSFQTYPSSCRAPETEESVSKGREFIGPGHQGRGFHFDHAEAGIQLEARSLLVRNALLHPLQTDPVVSNIREAESPSPLTEVSLTKGG